MDFSKTSMFKSPPPQAVPRLASARSRSGSERPPDVHSLPSRRFATLLQGEAPALGNIHQTFQGAMWASHPTICYDKGTFCRGRCLHRPRGQKQFTKASPPRGRLIKCQQKLSLKREFCWFNSHIWQAKNYI